MVRLARLLAQLPLGAPRLDVYEQDGYLVVKADVPGVEKEDVRVELDGGDLVIQGETRTENEVKEDQYYRIERRLGRFYRRVPLPIRGQSRRHPGHNERWSTGGANPQANRAEVARHADPREVTTNERVPQPWRQRESA